MSISTKRLSSADRELARQTFAVMSKAFEMECESLSDSYLERLLSREEFWAFTALAGDQIVGGLTAHTLPMTRAESSEIFIYDIAVLAEYRRKGVGRLLVRALREASAAVGIGEMFVPADNEDTHALDFYRALGGAESPVTFFTFGPE